MRFSNRDVSAEDAASILEVTEREINNRQQRQTQEFRYVRHIPECTVMSYRQFPSVAAPAKPAAEPTVAARYCNSCNIIGVQPASNLR